MIACFAAKQCLYERLTEHCALTLREMVLNSDGKIWSDCFLKIFENELTSSARKLKNYEGTEHDVPSEQ